jgi:hypothetical protein
MNASDSTSNKPLILWDVLFFLRVGKDFFPISADNLRTATITEPTWPFLDQLGKMHSETGTFLCNNRDQIRVCAFRQMADTDHHAIFRALESLHYYIDMLVLSGFSLPLVSPSALVRKSGDPDAELNAFSKEEWIQMNSKNAAAEQQWKDRSIAILKHVAPFLSTIIEGTWDPTSDILKRVLYSARLFRKGVESKAFGLEFLCKFAALENLVVGGEAGPKGKMFTRRLTDLVRALLPSVTTTIQKLSALRHKIVHEARIEYIEADPESYPVHIHMADLDWLFQATVTFVAVNGMHHTSLKALWSSAGAFIIPSEVAQQRPKDFAVFPASSISLRPGILFRQAGLLFDKLWSLPIAALESDNPIAKGIQTEEL